MTQNSVLYSKLSILFWTPWVNMTSDWISTHNLDATQCSSDVVGTCMPVLTYHSTFSSWKATLTPDTQTFVDDLSLEEDLSGPHLFPNFTVEIPSQCQGPESRIPSATLVTSGYLPMLRHQFMTLYQNALIKTDSRCDEPYVEDLSFYLDDCDEQANITITTQIFNDQSIRASCLHHTCVSTLHGHDEQCLRITNSTTCDRVPLCYACPTALSAAPTPPLEKFTFPPTYAQKIVNTEIEHNFLAVLGVFIVIVLVLISVPWLQSIFGTNVADSEESVGFLDTKEV